MELIDPDNGEPVVPEPGASGELVHTSADRECCPHLLDQAPQGTPARFSACIAENEEDSPWEPTTPASPRSSKPSPPHTGPLPTARIRDPA
ncbi:hypothetical protein ABZW11_44695 [Nonomuraea sp. NPDC004580]|uniref:hypothetical protein n=1 Tax=Nonomuraea sp. NPDC004580 TaxID=3154552 RepID=UPI0033BE7568